jgi:hypothetical protein
VEGQLLRASRTRSNLPSPPRPRGRTAPPARRDRLRLTAGYETTYLAYGWSGLGFRLGIDRSWPLVEVPDARTQPVERA